MFAPIRFWKPVDIGDTLVGFLKGTMKDEYGWVTWYTASHKDLVYKLHKRDIMIGDKITLKWCGFREYSRGKGYDYEVVFDKPVRLALLKKMENRG